MAGGLRWSEQNHAQWKARESARRAIPIVGEANTQDRPMAKAVHFILPWPPSGNHGTKHANGAHYLTEEHKQYREDVARAVSQQRVQPVPGRLSVKLLCFPPDNRRRDLDNLAKVALDAIQHAGIYADDGAIDELYLKREQPRMYGYVHVHVGPA